MILKLIIYSIYLAVSIFIIVFYSRSGKRIEDIFDELYLLSGDVKSISREIESIKTSLRAIAETTAETAATVEQMQKEKEASELPDEEAARRAKEEIDRFNTGIANILSFGTDEKDGGKK